MKALIAFLLLWAWALGPVSIYAANEGAVGMCDAGNGEQRACIQGPEGIIAGSAKVSGFVATMNWILIASSLGLCVMCLLKASSRLSDEQYREAIGPSVGAGVAALAMFIAYKMLN